MAPLLQRHPSCVRRGFLLRLLGALSWAAWLAALGCGGITCPEPLSDVDGMCLKLDPVMEPDPVAEVERCDGVDNDGDTEVDEDWPELGAPCGDRQGVGECVGGEWACAADGRGVLCEGAVGPVAEVCDGKDNDCDGTPDNGPDEICDGEDNDCDGLIDEGVLSVKSEIFANRTTVAAIDGGFAVTRVIGDRIRVDTYDTSGEPSGGLDTIDSPAESITFLTSNSDGQRVLVALGKNSFHVLEVSVGAGMVPIILGTQVLHEDWDQPTQYGVYIAPFHPRVLASPPRFVGYRDLGALALTPFDAGSLDGLASPSALAMEFSYLARFDAAGPFVIWNDGYNLRAAWVLDDGSLLLDIDVARGEQAGIGIGADGPGVAYLQDGALRLSELGGLTLLCRDGGFCNDGLVADELRGLAGPTALAYDAARDTWFVAAGAHVAVVGRGEDGALVKQALVVGGLGDAPTLVEVEVSGGTAAVVQAQKSGQSALTFLGCF